MTNDEGDGTAAPPPADPTIEPAATFDPPLEELAVPTPATSSNDDLREAVGVGRLDEKAARRAEKEAAKAAGREQVRLQKEAKAQAKAEALRAAGAPAELDATPDELDDDAPNKRSRTPLMIALSALGSGLIAAVVLLGRVNAERYLITCSPQKIVAQQGRGFPPWGVSPIGGAEWKPIPIPPGAECEARETSDLDELTGWYLDALVDQAQVKLTAREVNEVDEAQRELEQALLLARAPERRDQRNEIDRLLGDVEYWRGAARVREATETLEEAAKRFDEAADKRPRHASDAAAWAEFIRRTAAELLAGPAGVRPDTVAQPGVDGPGPQVPTGVALPVEDQPSMTMPDAAPPPSIDAGLPQGGVLL